MDDALHHLSQVDPIMAGLIARYPSPALKKHTHYYQELVDSIISQQLSVRAAAAIEDRFKAIYGGTFPAPEQIITTDIETLRSAGLSRPKATYIQDLARHIIDGTVDFSQLDSLSNDEIVTELVKVKGIGEWTAHMFLMFCMGRLDVLPTGDLGIRNGVARLFNFDHVPDAREIEELASARHWHPYESVASWYIWQSLENKPAL